MCRPRKAGEAIALGIEKLQGGDPRAAIDLFQRALELPGNGAYRLAGTPKEYMSVPAHNTLPQFFQANTALQSANLAAFVQPETLLLGQAWTQTVYLHDSFPTVYVVSSSCCV